MALYQFEERIKVMYKVDKKQKDFWSYGKKLYVEMAHRYIAPGAFMRID